MAGQANDPDGGDKPQPLTVPSTSDPATFMQFDHPDDLQKLEADIAILGIPHGQPYTADKAPNDQSNGPTAIRAAPRSVSGGLERGISISAALFSTVVTSASSIAGRARRRLWRRCALPVCRTGGSVDSAGRCRSDCARRRPWHSDPGATRLRRERADHAHPDRRPHRLGRRKIRRPRRLFQPDPEGFRNGPCRGDLSDWPARPGPMVLT